jgi:ADP-ribose/FAD diphosphatase
VLITSPYAHWDIPAIGQAYILFRAELEPPYAFSPGPETLETRLFSPDEIPYDSLAFSSVAITLQLWVQERQQGRFRVHHGVIDKLPGSSPNDPATLKLTDHFVLGAVA